MFVLAFNNNTNTVPNYRINNTDNRVLRNSHQKYFLPRVNITNYNVLINGKTFMINQLTTWSNSTTGLERLQQDKKMTTQQGVC